MKRTMVLLTGVAVLSVGGNGALLMLYSWNASRSNHVTKVDYYAARAFVRDEVARRDLVICAVPPRKRDRVKVGDHSILVMPIDDDAIGADRHNQGSFWAHHNRQMVRYGAFRYCSGNRELGMAILKLLAESGANVMAIIDDEGLQMPVTVIYDKARQEPEEARSLLSHDAEQWRRQMGSQPS